MDKETIIIRVVDQRKPAGSGCLRDIVLILLATVGFLAWATYQGSKLPPTTDPYAKLPAEQAAQQILDDGGKDVEHGPGLEYPAGDPRQYQQLQRFLAKPK
jgi:hypothetical protein